MTKNLFFRSLFPLALLTGIYSSSVLSSNAQETDPAAPTQQKLGAWVVTCPAKNDKSGVRCAAKVNLVDQKRNVEVMSWTLGFNKDGKLLMEVLTPSEILIEPGLVYALDALKPSTIRYYSCGIAGCLTRQPLNAASVGLLSKAKTAKFTIASTGGKTITLSINLAQTADAIKAIGYAATP